MQFLRGAVAFAALGFFALVQSSSLSAAPLRALTASLPPFTISAQERGITHDLVDEISKRSGVDIEIEYLPWKRAQSEAQKKPNTMIFAIGRTEKREPSYRWITNLTEAGTVFVSMDRPIDSYDEARSLSLISVLANTPRDRLLKAKNFTNYRTVQESKLAVRILDGGRADAWLTLDARAKYLFKREGKDPSKLVLGKPLSVLGLWLASNPSFDDAVAEKLKAAMDSIRADGTYDKILARYI